MASLKERAEALGRTELEMRSEMAAALGRIGRRLEDLIRQLRVLSEALSDSDPRTDSRFKEFQRVRSEAQRYYWYLIVQREAIGIRNHTNVIEHYKIPNPPVHD